MRVTLAISAQMEMLPGRPSLSLNLAAPGSLFHHKPRMAPWLAVTQEPRLSIHLGCTFQFRSSRTLCDVLLRIAAVTTPDPLQLQGTCWFSMQQHINEAEMHYLQNCKTCIYICTTTIFRWHPRILTERVFSSKMEDENNITNRVTATSIKSLILTYP